MGMFSIKKLLVAIREKDIALKSANRHIQTMIRSVEVRPGGSEISRKTKSLQWRSRLLTGGCSLWPIGLRRGKY